MPSMIKQCHWCATTGYPNFEPLCEYSNRLKASIKCHSKRLDCPYYKPYDIANPPKKLKFRE